jgi:hypothetical protein
LGQRITLPGHFLEPVTLEAIRFIGSGYECRDRLGDGTPDEAILSLEEAAALAGQVVSARAAVQPAGPEKLLLLVESARIRLAYAHDRQFAVSLSGIRTLPHQIEAVYMKMLPQPRLRFLLADDPGAGKTIMAGLLLKEMKLRGAIERILILCPAPLTIQWQDELLRWFGEPFEIIVSAAEPFGQRTRLSVGCVREYHAYCIHLISQAVAREVCRYGINNTAGRQADRLPEF